MVEEFDNTQRILQIILTVHVKVELWKGLSGFW